MCQAVGSDVLMTQIMLAIDELHLHSEEEVEVSPQSAQSIAAATAAAVNMTTAPATRRKRELRHRTHSCARMLSEMIEPIPTTEPASEECSSTGVAKPSAPLFPHDIDHLQQACFAWAVVNDVLAEYKAVHSKRRGEKRNQNVKQEAEAQEDTEEGQTVSSTSAHAS